MCAIQQHNRCVRICLRTREGRHVLTPYSQPCRILSRNSNTHDHLARETAYRARLGRERRARADRAPAPPPPKNPRHPRRDAALPLVPPAHARLLRALRRARRGRAGRAALAARAPPDAAPPVPRGPFVHKKTQENLEHRTHRRTVTAWDAHPDVIDMLVQYLERHVASGVGMRAVKWQRAPVGVGRKTMEGVLAIGHMRLDEQTRSGRWASRSCGRRWQRRGRPRRARCRRAHSGVVYSTSCASRRNCMLRTFHLHRPAASEPERVAASDRVFAWPPQL